MKLDHSNSDHRPTLLRVIKLYTEDDKGERTLLTLQHLQPLLIPAHVKWGVEVEYEPNAGRGARAKGIARPLERDEMREVMADVLVGTVGAIPFVAILIATDYFGPPFREMLFWLSFVTFVSVGTFLLVQDP